MHGEAEAASWSPDTAAHAAGAEDHSPRGGVQEICRQEGARAQDVAPAQLGTYAMPGGLDTLNARQLLT